MGAMALAIVWIAFRSQKYTRSVTDFLAAGRTARRYLLTVTSGATGHAAIRVIATFEIDPYKTGFVTWFRAFLMPVGVFINLTGFVVYRFRETRASTLRAVSGDALQPKAAPTAIVTGSTTALVGIVALIQNSKRMDPIEHQLDLIQADLKEFFRDTGRIR